jgi:ketosteroid isomerase-like protein
MKNRTYLSMLCVLCAISVSCSHSVENDRALIAGAESDFASMAEEEGIAEAFFYFAADSAVILRGGKLIKGKGAIKEYYQKNLKPGTKLLWAPDFIDVSGDIGYTYGKYTHMVPDSAGNMTESHGLFHTVWKRQPDGGWRYVWD